MRFIDWDDKEHELPEGREYRWRPSGYAVVLQEKKVLLLKHVGSGRWSLPGGGINLGEALMEGVRREVLEETGYEVRVTSKRPFYLGDEFFYTLNTDEYFHAVVFCVVATTTDAPAQGHADKVESGGAAWFSFEELKGLELQPFARKLLDAFFDSQMVGSK